MSLLNNERISVCREHAHTIAERQQFADSILFFNQKLKEQAQRHAIEVRARDMRLREAVASFQRALGSRQQVYTEAITREKLRLDHARMRMEQLRAFAPNASRLLSAYKRRGILPERRR
jgi:hypothetical protein